VKPVGEWPHLGRWRAVRPRLRTRAGVTLLVLAGVSALVAAYVVMTGGITTSVGGIPLRARSWQRPATIAAVAALAALIMLRHRVRAAVPRTVVIGPGRQRVLVAVAVTATAVVSLVFGTYAAGGSDSYGYLSQARLFARGQLLDTYPTDSAFTWPGVRWTMAPLGYRPGTTPGTLSPTYPPGLPLLMAPLAAVDTRAAFLIVPFAAMLAVWLCWQLGLVLREPLAGALGACLLASSPTFLYHAVQPMSDVPVTACWVAALLLARRVSPWGSVAAGAAASLAILIRPNLAPLALFVVLAAATAGAGGGLLRAATCALAMLPGITTLGAINWVRFGSPLSSGYGSLDYLFSAANIVPNLERYPGWLTASHTPFVWVWLATPWWLRRAPPRVRSAGWLLWGFGVAVFAAYLPYAVFNPDEWSYTRFLLPAIPVMLVLGVVVALTLARAATRYAEAVVVLLVAGIVVAGGMQAMGRGVFELWTVERRYPALGAFVRTTLPANAFVVADQHSGSIRFYADRPTLRWTVLDRASLGTAVEGLREAGYAPYVALEAHEVPLFRERFAESPELLDRLTLVATVEGTRVFRAE
jgi:hypothetical protein